MKYRVFGKTGWNVSEVGLGTWQVGGGWGKPFDLKKAEIILHSAIDQGINFVDTADVYDGGLSESAVGKVIRERKEKIYVATKCGRRIQPHTQDGYTPERLRKYVEDSLRNLGLEQIDLILSMQPNDTDFTTTQLKWIGYSIFYNPVIKIHHSATTLSFISSS